MAARAREEVMPAYPLPAQQAWRTSRFFLEAGLIFSEPRKHAGGRHNNQNNNERGSWDGVKAQSNGALAPPIEIRAGFRRVGRALHALKPEMSFPSEPPSEPPSGLASDCHVTAKCAPGTAELGSCPTDATRGRPLPPCRS